MADFSLPTLVTQYADFLVQMKERDEDIIKMFDGTTSLNLPIGSKRWNSVGNKFEKYDGNAWSNLSALYEIKVRDSDRLNGQSSSYYAVATHTHSNYASLNHSHSDYATTGHNHDTAYLGKTAQASDSAKLSGYSASSNAGSNSIGLRDSAGDFWARLFRSTYSEQTAAPATTADICFRNDSTNDNYMRFMTADAFKSWLTSIGVSISDTNTWRSITDSVSTTSSTISASATAVKSAYDRATTALNTANANATTTTAVASATAGIGAGGVGSYAFMDLIAGSDIAVGSTTAGSNLRYACITATYRSTASTLPSGTWRAMGNGKVDNLTLWLRIA